MRPEDRIAAGYEHACAAREAAAEIAEELAEAREAHAEAERLEAEAAKLWDAYDAADKALEDLCEGDCDDPDTIADRIFKADCDKLAAHDAAHNASALAEEARAAADDYIPLPDGDCDPPEPDYAPDDHPLNQHGMSYRDTTH